MLRAKGQHKDGSSAPDANVTPSSDKAESGDFGPQLACFASQALGTAQQLMASLQPWSKCLETPGGPGSKSAHHGKRNKTGQRLTACLIQLLSHVPQPGWKSPAGGAVFALVST